MSAWSILALPPILWQSPWPDAAFAHVSSTIDCSGQGDRRGQTIWHTADGAGLGWEWVELERGTLGLGDPMGIVSNICFIDDQKCPVGARRRSLLLNALVHEIRWQTVVRRSTRELMRASAI